MSKFIHMECKLAKLDKAVLIRKKTVHVNKLRFLVVTSLCVSPQHHGVVLFVSFKVVKIIVPHLES